MTREELREKLANTIRWKSMTSEEIADAAIALVLEEAARVAGPSPDDAGTHRSYQQGREDAAAAIRALGKEGK